MPSTRRVAVLLGGTAPERAVSLATGKAVLEALGERGHVAWPLFVDRDLDLNLRQNPADAAFVALHGRAAGGALQGLLEVLGVPFTGPRVADAALAADRGRTKEALRLHDLPTPAGYVTVRGQGAHAAMQHGGFGYPCVVKPRRGGGGVGVALARDVDELEAALETALRLDDAALVERFVDGPELQVVILDDTVLGVAEVGAVDGGLLDYKARARVEVMTPPRLGRERLRGVHELALRARQVVAPSAPLCRVDLLLSLRRNEQILGVNPLPELATGSVTARVAAAAGLPLPALLPSLIERLLDDQACAVRPAPAWSDELAAATRQ